MGRLRRWFNGISDGQRFGEPAKRDASLPAKPDVASPNLSARPASSPSPEVPVFPWDRTYRELMDIYPIGWEVERAGDSPSRVRKKRTVRAARELGLRLPLWREDRLAAALYLHPVDRVDGYVDNNDLHKKINQQRVAHETGSGDVQSLVLAEGFFDGPKYYRKFRPTGSSGTYELIGETGKDGRGIGVFSPFVSELNPGNSMSLVCFMRVSERELFSRQHGIFPETSLADSLFIASQLFFALNKTRHRFPVSVDETELDQFWFDKRSTHGFVPFENGEEDADARDRMNEFLEKTFPEVERSSRPELMRVMRSSVVLPDRRLIKTPRDAELYAAEFMDGTGFTNVFATAVGPDGGIDVYSDEGIAQVKLEGKPSSRQQLQQLSGVAMHEGKIALFFSAAGYTLPALEWAARSEMALFEFARDGSIEACSDVANDLLRFGVSYLD